MLKIGIVGGTGYTGSELARLIAMHPHAELHCITSRSESGKTLSDLYPHLGSIGNIPFLHPDKAPLQDCDVVFFATPHGVAMAGAPDLLDKGIKVIDLSADFRLKDADVFTQHYAMKHTAPDALRDAVYGLCELNRDAIKTARLIANPGCYPTTVQLGLAPLVKQGLIHVDDIIADCKSGISGAGRSGKIALLYGENAENFKAYGVSGHRHQPEIEEQISAISGDKNVEIQFTPHLVPMTRGIESTIYAPLKNPDAHSTESLTEMLADAYDGEPFVHVLPVGSHPETRHVTGTNNVQIAVHKRGKRAIILVVEDNLIKGASGQAIQNMNIMCGFTETDGLQSMALGF